MRELSLNALDIAQNSLSAGAKHVFITLTINRADDFMSISIEDDGCGMDKEFLAKIVDPYTTTRTTRKVGMGIPLFKYSAESSGGTFTIESEKGKGTKVTATYRISHVDRMPLGDMNATLLSLISMNCDTDFIYTVNVDGKTAVFDTAEIKKQLEGVPLSSLEVISFLKEYLEDNFSNLYGGNL